MSNQVKLEKLKNPEQKEDSTSLVKSGFFNVQGFELMQRIAKSFASSDLVPESYKGNIANCMIALDMADRIGAAPLSVMQSMYIVHGQPSWSSKFLIATVNACGRYSSLRYEWQGKPGADIYGCRAWAIEKDTGQRLEGVWVTWAMVKEEKWDEKKGSKWKTMPDQMFIYRAAAFWQRAYAPELAMGLTTAEEAIDVYDASRKEDGSYSVDIESLKGNARKTVDVETGEIVARDIKEEEIIEDSRTEPAQFNDDIELPNIDLG
ncbi:MAG: hypothetical protein E6Q61_09410 [Nitrosomonas sp.]|nr:MAG: hypothetical protein E6Q61_09410 [Nitrosomonas sp.]